MNHPLSGAFSPADIAEIRRQWDDGSISVKAWAEARNCSRETVRKVGRRETYRQIANPPQGGVGASVPLDLDDEAIRASIRRLNEARPTAEVMLEELVGKSKGGPA